MVMALMYPDYIPDYLKKDPARFAEIRFYELLKRSLTDQHFVLYSVDLILRKKYRDIIFDVDPGNGEPVRLDYPLTEADFIIIHPSEGILVVEVKGGGIQIENGNWYNIDRHNIKHSIKDPLKQARSNFFSFLLKLKEIQDFKNRLFIGGYAAFLMDVGLPENSSEIFNPKELFRFSESLNRLGLTVSEIMSYWKRLWKDYYSNDISINLKKKEIDKIVRSFAPTISLKKHNSVLKLVRLNSKY
jgi:hypothetical protein